MMLSPQYVEGLELRIKELEAQLAAVNADATRWQNRWIEADKQLAEMKKQDGKNEH